jgi:hypothetical protein
MTESAFRAEYKNMVKYEAEEPEKDYNMPYYFELYYSSNIFFLKDYRCVL